MILQSNKVIEFGIGEPMFCFEIPPKSSAAIMFLGLVIRNQILAILLLKKLFVDHTGIQPLRRIAQFPKDLCKRFHVR